MEKINVKKIGIASGITGMIFYLGCVLIMSLLGKEVFVKIANLLFHGTDFTSIARMNIPVFESILGLFVSFIFWGAIGYIIATIYNKIK